MLLLEPTDLVPDEHGDPMLYRVHRCFKRRDSGERRVQLGPRPLGIELAPAPWSSAVSHHLAMMEMYQRTDQGEADSEPALAAIGSAVALNEQVEHVR